MPIASWSGPEIDIPRGPRGLAGGSATAIQFASEAQGENLTNTITMVSPGILGHIFGNIKASLLPILTQAHDLGSNSRRWQTLFLGAAGAIKFGNNAVSLDASVGVAGDLGFFAGSTEFARINSTALRSGEDLSNASPGQGDSKIGISVNFATSTIHVSSANSATVVLNRNNNGSISNFRRDNTLVGSITVSETATAYNTSSDYRLKEGEVPLSDAMDVGEIIDALKPYRFTWKSTGHHDIGFFAHELAEHVPNAVTGEKDAVDDNGDPVHQGVDLSKIIPLLVAEIQNQRLANAALEQRIAALEAGAG